jgi:hypothetical protein
VSYASAGYDKATNIATATPEELTRFIAQPLNAAPSFQTEMNDSVLWDSNGVTVTDPTAPNNQVRISGDGIYMRNENCRPMQWKTALTADGLNASSITTGSLDTGSIQIMKNNEVRFRWDDAGITAFDTDTDPSKFFAVNSKKGVRFDQFGIYGFDGVEGMTWRPTDLNDVKSKAMYSLTWDGLNIKLLNASYDGKGDVSGVNQYAVIGKAENQLYDGWLNGTPVWTGSGNAFAKLIAVGSEDNGTRNDKFSVYSDGTMVAKDGYFKGRIESETGTIGGIFLRRNGLSIPSGGRETSKEVTVSLERDGIYRGGMSYNSTSKYVTIRNY